MCTAQKKGSRQSGILPAITCETNRRYATSVVTQSPAPHSPTLSRATKQHESSALPDTGRWNGPSGLQRSAGRSPNNYPRQISIRGRPRAPDSTFTTSIRARRPHHRDAVSPLPIERMPRLGSRDCCRRVPCPTPDLCNRLGLEWVPNQSILRRRWHQRFTAGLRDTVETATRAVLVKSRNAGVSVPRESERGSHSHDNESTESNPDDRLNTPRRSLGKRAALRSQRSHWTTARGAKSTRTPTWTYKLVWGFERRKIYATSLSEDLGDV